MLNSAILSIAIALIFIFLLLSVMVTAINELVFTFLKSRSKQLEFFLKKLYFNDSAWTGIFDNIKNSPFINVLKKYPDVFPGSIPAENFTTALLAYLGKGKLTIEAINKAVEENDAKEALEPTKTKSGFFFMLKAILSQKPTMEQLSEELDKIYENAMVRLTSWYRRSAKILSFVFAFVICAGLNVDSITITKNLWNNKDKAEQIASFAAMAGKYLEKNDSSQVVFKDGIDTLAYIKVENKALTKSKTDKIIAGIAKSGEGSVQEKQLVTSYNIMANLDIPIGWSSENAPPFRVSSRHDFVMWLLKLLGILLTTAAVSMGAPYWFDILNKITPLKQGAGKTTTAQNSSIPAKTDGAITGANEPAQQ
jgi:hypothetical protein